MIFTGSSLLAACSQQTEHKSPANGHTTKPASIQRPIDLTDLFGFSRPAECQDASPFGDVLRQLFQYESETDRAIPGRLVVPTAYAAAFGPPVYTHGNQDAADVSVPVNGTWHGLRVRGLYAYAWDGGDPGGFRLSFAEPKAKVVSTLARLGFKPPPSGTSNPRDPDTEETMTITSNANGTTDFGCGM